MKKQTEKDVKIADLEIQIVLLRQQLKVARETIAVLQNRYKYEQDYLPEEDDRR